MEEKVMKFSATILFAVAIGFSVLYLKLPDVQAFALAKQEAELSEGNEVVEEQQEMNILEIVDHANAEAERNMQLRMELPEGVEAAEVYIENDYVTQTLRIEIPHSHEDYYANYPITGSSDHIAELRYLQGRTKDMIEIVTDQVYEVVTDSDEEFYYLDFVSPQDMYDYVVVIDAGHGGNDGGAEKWDVMEKDIDLAIVLQLKELLDETDENIGFYYTRTDDSNPSYERRAGLANKSQADLFISVHSNSYKRSSSIKGTEVMYSESFEGDFTSERLAEICLEEVVSSLDSRNRGTLEGDSIYIIKNSKVPVALIEVGFMTNREELRLLTSEEYQKKAAEGIYNAIFRALEEKGNQ